MILSGDFQEVCSGNYAHHTVIHHISLLAHGIHLVIVQCHLVNDNIYINYILLNVYGMT